MRSIVIYDSYFGNTKIVAETIGIELGKDIKVENVKQINMEDLKDIDVLFIGSPTRIFTCTKSIKKLLKNIGKYNSKIKVFCFDTRMHITENEPRILRKLVKKFGYAVDSMEKILSKKKNIRLLESKWFYVEGTEGPITNEELEKTKEWVKELKVNVLK